MEVSDGGSSESKIKGYFKIPCMRTAFLYGVGGGVGTGIATFLLTSRVKRSADVAVSVFAVVTMCSFVYCRYDRAKMKMTQERYRQMQGIESIDIKEV